MTESDDDLTAALHRELAGVAVPHDDALADAMIGAATAADPLAGRRWQAPLAAAAAVVVVGGGVAAIAGTHHSGSTPSGGAPFNDAPAACTPVSASSTPAASVTAVPAGIRSAVPCAPTPNSSAIYPLPAVSSASTSPSAPLPTAGVATPSAPPSNVPPLSGASLTPPVGVTRFDLRVAPGGSTTQVAHGSLLVRSAHLVSVSGTSGTVAVYRGSAPTSMQDRVGAFVEETITPDQPVQFTPAEPLSVRVTCAGTTVCSVEVTLSAHNQR